MTKTITKQQLIDFYQKHHEQAEKARQESGKQLQDAPDEEAAHYHYQIIQEQALISNISQQVVNNLELLEGVK